MAKYLDETGLRTLWTKIKGTFVAQTIKKSDSSNATQIIHDGDTVSLSRGTISGTGSASTYTASAGIDIGVDDMITFTSTSRPQWRIDKNHDNIGVAILSDLDGKSNTGHTHSYNDLTNKPTIGNAQITIRQNGTEKGSFTLNQTSAKAIDLIDTTYTPATTSAPGLMSATDKTNLDNLSSKWTDEIYDTLDSVTRNSHTHSNKSILDNTTASFTTALKTKLDGIETGANKTIVDTALNSTSTNPVQNKVIFTALNNKLNTSDFNAMKGATNGLATLDSNGKVPSSQLPSYVDDVIEGYYYNNKFYKEESHTTVITGESGKIYTDLGNNKTYRWSGTTYTEISASLALGETSSTAYPGNKGAANAANITTNANNITTLKGYFTGNVANKAAADGDGNNIVDTYATKQNLSSVAQNASAKIDKSVLTAKGDIIYASAANTPTRLGIGANGKVLKVANGVPSWADDINTNTAHSHSAGVGLTGSGNAGTSGTYTYKVNLRDEHVAPNSSTYTAGGSTKFYAVQLDKENKLSVYVPWTDTNTTYSAGTGLSLSGTTFSLNTNYVATKTANGLMSKDDKTKLDNFEGAISTDYINALS